MDGYSLKVYGGILGKIIGVYAGRPVEGWSYEHIREVFGEVEGYVNGKLGMPLHVPDDDLSGTFAFLRTLEDFGAAPRPQDYGETWLNYVIENRTVFWWGGMGRSTEHTAYLRLKSGVRAPESGSMRLNGQTTAEQIGAMIFIDAFALACPGDAPRAREYAARAASVSHDGFAVEAACFLVTLESLAFCIRDLNELLDAALADASWSPDLRALVGAVRGECAKGAAWRHVRSWLDAHYGYHLYPGNCHVVPNFALILAALLLGGDSFAEAMKIVISSGWDTDCNAANLGCLNGIRLGLDAVDMAYRAPVADRFYCISALGSQCVTDAVAQTDRILRLHAKLYDLAPPEEKPRFHFSYPGSVQGFTHCPVVPSDGAPVENFNQSGGADGLLLVAGQRPAAISTLTFWDPNDRYGGYELLGSPTLYEGQKLICRVRAHRGAPTVRLYVTYTDIDDHVRVCCGPDESVQGDREIAWRIPALGGMPIGRVGLQLRGGDGSAALLRSLDWRGAPREYALDGVLREEETGRPRRAFDQFTASASQFSVDKEHTLCVSHPEENGVADFGAEDWRDYSFTATVTPGLHDRCGLVVRARGHRRHYAAVLEGGDRLRLLDRCGGEETELASQPFSYAADQPLTLSVRCRGDELTVSVDGRPMLFASDSRHPCGGVGFLVSRGTMMADRVVVRSEEDQNA